MATRTLHHSGLVLLAKVGGAAAAYAVALALGRTFGAAAFGRFELGLTVVGLGAMLGRAGMDGAWVRHAPGWMAAGMGVRRVWWQAVAWVAGWSLLIGAVVLGFRGAIGERLGSEALVRDLGWAVVAIPALSLVGLVAAMVV